MLLIYFAMLTKDTRPKAVLAESRIWQSTCQCAFEASVCVHPSVCEIQAMELVAKMHRIVLSLFASSHNECNLKYFTDIYCHSLSSVVVWLFH